MRSPSLKFGNIKIGDVYEFEHKFTKDEVKDFAELTGDENPLHTDESFGAKSKFGRNIVHGMFAASLFSRLIGMYCPGRNALYLRQTIDFKGPIFPDDTVTVRGTVIDKVYSVGIIEFKTDILKNRKILVTGSARVQVMRRE